MQIPPISNPTPIVFKRDNLNTNDSQPLKPLNILPIKLSFTGNNKKVKKVKDEDKDFIITTEETPNKTITKVAMTRYDDSGNVKTKIDAKRIDYHA